MRKLSSKIGLSYFVMVVLVLLSGYIAISSNLSAGEDTHLIANVIAPQIDASMEIKVSLAEAHLWTEEVMGGKEEHEAMDDVYEKIDAAYFYANALVEGGENDEGKFYRLENQKDIDSAKAIAENIVIFKKATEDRFENFKQGNESVEADEAFDVGYEALIEEADVLETAVQERMSDVVSMVEANRTRQIIISGVFMGIAAILAVILVMITINIVVKPVNKVVVLLKDIAEGEGDLTKRIDINSKDEIGEMANWFNVFIKKLQRMVGNTQEQVYELSKATEATNAIVERSNESIEGMARSVETISTGA